MLQITVNDKSSYQVEHEESQWLLNKAAVDCDISVQPNSLVSVLVNNKSYTAIIEKIDKENKEIVILINGRKYHARIEDPIDQLLNNMGLSMKAGQKADPVKAPMPGLVLKILVEPGQKVNKGDGLLVLEAMKMENMIKATVAATVKAIKVNERMAVEKGMVMIEME